ncbi:MAG TPA: hypothetical protein VK149_05945 [Sideroxyarcus sp.]|nr:hypothetical protein [Sideroxyarcus sp.]
MMNTLNMTRWFAVGLLYLLLSLGNVAAAAPPIVEVYGTHFGGKVQYHYRVKNNGLYPISSVWIGHDTLNDADYYNDVWELKTDISGMFVNKKYPSPDYFDIPAASVTSPPGWEVRRISLEETEEISINWLMADDYSQPVAPSQTMGGMSVTLDKMDMTYITSHATINFGGRSKKDEITVPLQRLDITPPALTVTLNPSIVRENDKLAPITATITVLDDYDPAPEIKLESIIASEPMENGDVKEVQLGTDDRQFQLKAESKTNAGRAYLVTYSATDGSGNRTTASATVSVQRKDEKHEERRDEKNKKRNKD